MANILVRASKSPFDNFYNGPIPEKHYETVYRSLNRLGTKNAGNLVYAHATCKVLNTESTEIDVENYDLTLDDNFQEQAANINAKYDALVLPLDNAFRADFKDHLARMTDNIKMLDIPVIVNGVGVQAGIRGNLKQAKTVESEAKEFVSAVLDRSATIGVRGEFTRNYLRKLGFPDSAIDVIGCPSMFYHGENLSIRPLGELGPIALNLLLSTNGPILTKFAKVFNDHPEGVTYIPQVRNVMKKYFKNQIPNEDDEPTSDNPVPRLLARRQVAHLVDLLPWMDFLAEKSFTIGPRIHGNLVSLLAGTPAHVIAHDSRTLELAEFFEVPHTKVTKLRKFDLEKAYSNSDPAPIMKGHSARLANYASFLEKNGLQHSLYDQQQLVDYDRKARFALENETQIKD